MPGGGIHQPPKCEAFWRLALNRYNYFKALFVIASAVNSSWHILSLTFAVIAVFTSTVVISAVIVSSAAAVVISAIVIPSVPAVVASAAAVYAAAPHVSEAVIVV